MGSKAASNALLEVICEGFLVEKDIRVSKLLVESILDLFHAYNDAGEIAVTSEEYEGRVRLPAFTILRILESTWYIKAKVSISKQPKVLVLVDFEPFDWAHFNPILPPPPQGAEPPQDNWDNWD